MSQPADHLPPLPPEAPAPPQYFALRMPVLLLFIGYWTALIVGTHIPKVPRVVDLNNLDKLLHFAAYAGLAFGACLAWRMQRPRYASLTWRHYALVLLVLAIYGSLDELTQPFVGRSCELTDWLADVLGATAGIATFIIANAVRRRWLGSLDGQSARRLSAVGS